MVIHGAREDRIPPRTETVRDAPRSVPPDRGIREDDRTGNNDVRAYQSPCTGTHNIHIKSTSHTKKLPPALPGGGTIRIFVVFTTLPAY